MNSKELKKMVRDKNVKRIYAMFGEMYLRVTKIAIIELCDEYYNKDNWGVHLTEGYLFIDHKKIC